MMPKITRNRKTDRDLISTLSKIMKISIALFLTGYLGLWSSYLIELRSGRISGSVEKSKVVKQQESRVSSHQHSFSTSDSKQSFAGKPNSNHSVTRNLGNAAETQSSSEVRAKEGDRNLWKDLKTWFENQSPLRKCFVIFTVLGFFGMNFVAWLSASLPDKEGSSSKSS
jgi:hypothetical protein